MTAGVEARALETVSEGREFPLSRLGAISPVRSMAIMERTN
jgi:hypothetical protein